MSEIIQTEKALPEYWQTLVRRRWTALSFFLICFITVALGTFLMTPLYRSETKMIVESESTDVSSSEDASLINTSYDIYENYLETQMALILSDSVAGKVAEEFKLWDMPRYRKRWGAAKIFQKTFTDDIYLERLPGTRMIRVAVENPDPKLAAKLANRLAEVYAKDNMMRRALTFIRNQRMASLNSEFLRLQSKLDSMSNQFGPLHPDMVALKEEIRAISRRMENERFAQTSGAGSELEKDQQMLEQALLKIQESSVLASSRMNNIGIVDPAVPTKTIARPKYALNLALGLVGGLVGGVLLAFFLDYLDDSVKTEDELKRRIKDSYFLGTVLYEKGPKSDKTGPKHSTPIDRVVADHSDSASAEAYRLIRTRVLWSIAKNSDFHDLAVVSSIPGEGKTTVACNLAIALSQLDKKVLLVDTDMRRGRLHTTFGFPNDKGLGQYLTENLPFEQTIKKTNIPGLSLVTCGESVINSSQLFGSPRMASFIREARQKFDYIVYDTPPMTVIADTVILVPQLHGTLLVARSGVARSRALAKALGAAEESKANLIGVVFNASQSNETITYNQYYNSYKSAARA